MAMLATRFQLVACALLVTLVIGFAGTGAAADAVEDEQPRFPHPFQFERRPFPPQDEPPAWDDEPRAGFGDRERAPHTAVVENGFVLWQGQYMAPPYKLTGAGEELYLNDQLVPSTSSPFQPVSFPGPRGSGRVGPNNRRGMLRHMLEANGILVVGPETSLTIRPEFAGRFLEALLSDDDFDVRMSEIANQMNGSGLPTNVNWASYLNAFVPTQELRDRYDAMFPSSPDALSENSQPTTTVTKRTFRYLMTVVGMVLGVFGFGMLLQHQPHAQSTTGKVAPSGTGFQFLPLYVGLVFLFGMFDLACTIFANETGGLLELNPLGSRLLNSTATVMFSKISVTAMSATILVKLRNYRIAQTAAWWLCLICVFLTLRWVTFTSMFLS